MSNDSFCVMFGAVLALLVSIVVVLGAIEALTQIMEMIEGK